VSFRIDADVVDRELRLTLHGRLDASAYESFVHAVRTPKGPIQSVRSDVSGLEAVDRASLGMLLIAREAAGASRATICGSSPELRRVLETVNFGQLFDLA